MTKIRERALEVFLYVTFPIALFVGCVGAGDFGMDSAFTDVRQYSPFEDENSKQADKASNGAVYENVILVKQEGIEDILQTSMQHVLLFPNKKHKLNEEHMRALRKHAQLLIRNPNLIVTICGYWDNEGLERYSDELGRRRAAEVYKQLVALGAPKEQLIVDANDASMSGSSWLESRRVELQYYSAFVAP